MVIGGQLSGDNYQVKLIVINDDGRLIMNQMK